MFTAAITLTWLALVAFLLSVLTLNRSQPESRDAGRLLAILSYVFFAAGSVLFCIGAIFP